MTNYDRSWQKIPSDVQYIPKCCNGLMQKMIFLDFYLFLKFKELSLASRHKKKTQIGLFVELQRAAQWFHFLREGQLSLIFIHKSDVGE